MGLRIKRLGGQHRIPLLDQAEGGTDTIETHIEH
jgi:hypothetical protein